MGIDCNFTRSVLVGLLNHGITIRGMVLPGAPGLDRPIRIERPQSQLPLARAQSTNGGILDVISDHNIEAYRVGVLSSGSAVNVFESFNATSLICACYPELIPKVITDLYPDSTINIHPSLLPDKRGPDPLFWTFREGTGRSGITLHHLSTRFDAGRILAQQAFQCPDGWTESALEQELAALAVELAAEVLPTLSPGSAGIPQDDSRATYAPWPSESDFRIETSMCVRAAFNFVRGIQQRGVPILVTHDGQDMVVVDVTGYSTETLSLEPGLTSLKLSDGYLHARLKTSTS